MKTMKNLLVKTLNSLVNPFIALYEAEKENNILMRNAKRMAKNKLSLECLLESSLAA